MITVIIKNLNKASLSKGKFPFMIHNWSKTGVFFFSLSLIQYTICLQNFRVKSIQNQDLKKINSYLSAYIS